MNSQALVPIGIAERETQISKDMLRKWEKRYGFPVPIRDARNERWYSAETLGSLKLIRVLLSKGVRPQAIVGMSPEQLVSLIKSRAISRKNEDATAIVQLQRLVVSDQISAVRQELRASLLRWGLASFVLDILVPLNRKLGEAWDHGDVSQYQAHWYSEHIGLLLAEAIAHLPKRSKAPRVLLAIPPGESHGLGIAMVHALCALAGSECIRLGFGSTAADVVAATKALDIHIVMASISGAYPKKLARLYVSTLLVDLPEPTVVWIGGAGAQGTGPQVNRLAVFDDLGALILALDRFAQSGIHTGMSTLPTSLEME